MCGRYQLHANPHELIEHFGAEVLHAFHFEPRYNASPTDKLPIVRVNAERSVREILNARWGFLPKGSRDPSAGPLLINARSETAHEKAAFRNAFQHRRCLVPAQGFYEWRRVGSRKQPYHIGRADGRLIGFAGLWDPWVTPDGEVVETFTILTTEPNDLVRPLHDRMPVVVPEEAYDAWLTMEPGDTALRQLLQTPSDAGWRAYPVTPSMNRPEHDAPDCIEEIAEPEEDGPRTTDENLDLFS